MREIMGQQNMNKIYVMMSFMPNDFCYPEESLPRIKEEGCLLWFSTMEEVENYFNKAGKETPEGTYYDDPCEFRWLYILVEEVGKGRSHNKIMGWWKGEYEGNRLTIKKLKETPVNVENQFNITGIG